MKLLFFLPFLGLFFGNIFGGGFIGTKKTDQTLDLIKKKFNATEPSPNTLKLAEEALLKCNINNEEITVLENKDPQESSHIYKSFANNKIYMIISESPYKNETEFSIYHELGHYKNGDLEEEKIDLKTEEKTCEFRKLTTNLIKNIAYITTIFKPKNQPKTTHTYAGALSYAYDISNLKSTLQFKKTIDTLRRYAPRRRKQELKADIFAHTKLIENGNITAILEKVADFLCTHENCPENDKILSSPFSTYPRNILRAYVGIKTLEKKNISIKKLIENMPKDIDAGIGEILPKKIQEYFPEYISKN